MKRKSTHATYTAAKRAGLLALAACLIFTGCGGAGESAAPPNGPAPMEEVPALLRSPPAVAAFLAGAGEAVLEERTGLICYAPWEGWESAFPDGTVTATEFQLDDSDGWNGFSPFAIQGDWVYGTRSDRSYFPKTAV